MKKKNLKNLSLKKSSVSKLNGGAIPFPNKTFFFCETANIKQCTWISELYTACFCNPTQEICPNTQQLDDNGLHLC